MSLVHINNEFIYFSDVGAGALAGMGDFAHLAASDTDLPRRMPVTCKFGHELKVSSVHVLNALQEFIASVVAADTAAKRYTLHKQPSKLSLIFLFVRNNQLF